MIQTKRELEEWYNKDDPWNYNNSWDDLKRKEILLAEIPRRDYDKTLDIGCGNGFITRELPGNTIIGIDISEKAIEYAQNSNLSENIVYKQGSIFDILRIVNCKSDLILVSGVLYPQYIGSSNPLIYILIDQLLNKDGILISVHIDEWYNSRFPYLMLKDYNYEYREYYHKLEVYIK